MLLAVFWLTSRAADAGPLQVLTAAIDDARHSPWAPLVLLGMYAARPFLLVPITVANLASGFLLGPAWGIALGMVGTLVSASVGYLIGRTMGRSGLPDDLTERWPFVSLLRRRSFVSVVAGGLMYLHADLVNVPAGLLRIRFPLFLLGIAIGNLLTMSTAVLTGASVEGDLRGASVSLDPWYLAAAALLFLLSFGVAYLLRSRMRPLE